MAYRQIHEKFWMDIDVSELPLKAKYLLLYLITNTHANQYGLYYLPPQYIELETGLTGKDVVETLKRLGNNVTFEEAFRYLLNRYQIGIGESPIGESITKKRPIGENDLKNFFCLYCHETRLMWVRSSMKYQLSYFRNPSARQVNGVLCFLDGLPKSPLIQLFKLYYADFFGSKFIPIGSFAYEHNNEHNNEHEQEQEQEQEQGFVVPDWINIDSWKAFEVMRQKIKKPLTDYASSLIIKEIEKLKQQGHEPAEVLNQSIRMSWQDVYPVKEKNSSGKQAKPKGTIDYSKYEKEGKA